MCVCVCVCVCVCACARARASVCAYVFVRAQAVEPFLVVYVAVGVVAHHDMLTSTVAELTPGTADIYTHIVQGVFSLPLSYDIQQTHIRSMGTYGVWVLNSSQAQDNDSASRLRFRGGVSVCVWGGGDGVGRGGGH